MIINGAMIQAIANINPTKTLNTETTMHTIAIDMKYGREYSQ